MKNNLKIVFSVILILTISLMEGYFLKNKVLKEKHDDLINISELSEEFMDDYFEEYSNIESENQKENMLIVTSLEKIDDSYGAAKIIEAPNNQYILEYKTEEEKNNALTKFKVDDAVLSVDENEMVVFDNADYNSWGIEKMGLDNTINAINQGELPEVKVAIIDTGCNVDLVNKYYPGKITETYNVLNDSTTDMSDTYGHGTHIAGTIAEGTPNNVKIIPIKVSTGRTQYVTDIVAAINYVVYYEKADVINMSFGMYDYNNALYNAIESANQKNIISVAAAGNDNSSSKHYPSAFDNTISIGSVDSELKKSSFSNYGTTIDFVAPGTNIKSTLSSDMKLSEDTDGDDEFEVISGTSMATPHAVNAVSILKSYNKDLTKDNIIDLLKDYAVKDLGIAGKDIYYGNGFIYFDPNSFCSNPAEDECEELGVFKSSSKTSISQFEVNAVLRTSYNYGTVNNFNPTELKVTYYNGSTVNVKVGDLSGVTITGYDPYATEEQTITINWQGIDATFKFTNPSDWESGWSYQAIDDENAKLTGFIDFDFSGSAIKKLYIPETIDGYNIVEIADNGYGRGIFDDIIKTSYEEIILPETVKTISGAGTFSGFSFVEKITTPSPTLTISGNNVFSENTSLTEITSVLLIEGTNTFVDDISLQDITLSDNTLSIPAHTFEGCTSLTDLVLPQKLKSIGDYAFYEAGIVDVVLPNTVENVGAYAFRQTSNRTVETVKLSSNLKTIGDFAFAGTLITEIDLPDSLKSIGRNAFARAQNLKSFYLPKNVTSLGTDIFIYCSSLETITVDPNNEVYDSRNNSNAIIETDTNTLLYGSSKTVIPDDIKKIGKDSFYYIEIEELSIPDGVEEIGDYAFYYTPLEKLFIPSSVETIGNKAFVGKDKNLITLWVDTTSYAKSYAVDNQIPYEATNQSYIGTSIEDYSFNAFDTVDASIYVYFDRGVNSGTSYKEWKKVTGRQETIDPDDVEIVYQDGRDSFRYGDTSFTVKGTTQYGEQFEKTFNVTISKATPIAPTNLTANLGQKLSDITLPSGFEWISPDTVIEEVGSVVFKAKYTPTDTTNYNVVDSMDITISVSNPRTSIVPTITVEDKTYDGKTTIDEKNITISNLDSTEYTIVSATSDSADVGDRKATIKLKLTDDKFANYSFDNGKQEKEFTIDFKIIHKKLTKPSKTAGDYVYNGNEITFDVQNYDSDAMNITGNKGTNVGKYTTVISLKNSNYLWEDNTSDNIELTYEIVKADLYVKDLSSNVSIKYDGKPHTVIIDLEYYTGTIVKYMDSNGEYTLNEAPQYTEVGTYVIKYKLYLDDNHKDYISERTLEITSNAIVNNSKDYEGEYDGKEHTIDIDIDLDVYDIKYSTDNVSFNLTSLPKYKDVGEYTIYYKVTADGYEEYKSSNKVKIYGIEKFNESITHKKNILIFSNNSFNNLINQVNIYSPSKIIRHLDNGKNVISSDIIKTGDIMEININNSKTYEYELAFIGDVNGNGEIDIIDYIRIMKDIMGTNKLSGVYYEAADMNRNNSIDIIDYIRVMKIIMEEK